MLKINFESGMIRNPAWHLQPMYGTLITGHGWPTILSTSSSVTRTRTQPPPPQPTTTSPFSLPHPSNHNDESAATPTLLRATITGQRGGGTRSSALCARSNFKTWFIWMRTGRAISRGGGGGRVPDMALGRFQDIPQCMYLPYSCKYVVNTYCR